VVYWVYFLLPEETMDYKAKLQNFWFYYRKHLLVALAVVLVLGYLGIQKRSAVQPDYHIGLVREIPCTEEELAALEATFVRAGTDVNGDGQVVVKLHTYYIDLADAEDAETVQALDADLIGKVSGIFLLEDVETFRSVTNGILAPGETPMDNGLYLTIRKDAAEQYTDLIG